MININPVDIALADRAIGRIKQRMSRKDALPSLERRVRRVAIRYGLHLMKAQKPDKRVLAHGGYMLRDVETFKILYGDADYLFSASLEDIEAWLNQQGKGEA